MPSTIFTARDPGACGRRSGCMKIPAGKTALKRAISIPVPHVTPKTARVRKSGIFPSCP